MNTSDDSGMDSSESPGMDMFDDPGMNSSGDPIMTAPVNSTATILVACAFSVIALVTVFGNMAVIATTVVEKRMRHPARILVTSLAGTDLLTGLLVMPSVIVYIVTERWVLGEFLCYTSLVVTIVVTQSSIWHLVMIALDRLLTVVWESYVLQKKRRRRIVTGMIWFSWVGATALPVIMCFTAGFPIVTPFFCVPPQNALFRGVTWVNGMALPMSLIIGLYIAVFINVRRLSGQEDSSVVKEKQALQSSQLDTISECEATPLSEIHHGCEKSGDSKSDDSAVSNNPRPEDEGIRGTGSAETVEKPENQRLSNIWMNHEVFANIREGKLLRILLIITLCFTAFWLPYAIILFIQFFTDVSGVALFGGIWVLFCNSTANPIVYSFICPEFRMASKSVYRKLRGKTDPGDKQESNKSEVN